MEDRDNVGYLRHEYEGHEGSSYYGPEYSIIERWDEIYAE